MAFFSTATDGSDYKEKWCSNCVHEDDCAVMRVHVLWNYEQLVNRKSEWSLRAILEELIPIGDDGFADKCSMYFKRNPMLGDGGVPRGDPVSVTSEPCSHPGIRKAVLSGEDWEGEECLVAHWFDNGKIKPGCRVCPDCNRYVTYEDRLAMQKEKNGDVAGIECSSLEK